MMGAVEHYAGDERCAGDKRCAGDERCAGDKDELCAVERCLPGDVLNLLARSETTSAARRNASPGAGTGGQLLWSSIDSQGAKPHRQRAATTG